MPTKLILHHYTSGSGLLGIIESSSLWATKIQYMNDSKEFAHSIDLAASELRRHKIKTPHGHTSALCDALIDRLDRLSQLAVYVACFSEVEDSLSQWRGYCPPSFGYSLGFDADVLGAIAKPQDFDLQPCIYDDDRKRKVIKEWVDSTLMQLSAACPVDADPADFCEKHAGRFITQFWEFAPYMKDKAFQDEREWRLVGLVPSFDTRLSVRAGKSKLVPYVPIKLDFTKAPELLWNAAIGPNPHMELAIQSLSLALRNCHFLHGVRPTSVPYRDW